MKYFRNKIIFAKIIHLLSLIFSVTVFSQIQVGEGATIILADNYLQEKDIQEKKSSESNSSQSVYVYSGTTMSDDLSAKTISIQSSEKKYKKKEIHLAVKSKKDVSEQRRTVQSIEKKLDANFKDTKNSIIFSTSIARNLAIVLPDSSGKNKLYNNVYLQPENKSLMLFFHTDTTKLSYLYRQGFSTIIITSRSLRAPPAILS